MCQINGATNLVQQWYNTGGYVTPSLLSSSNPSIGLSNASILTSNGVLNCLVTRQKSAKDTNNYFDISNKSYNLLVAYGTNDGSSKYLLSDG